MSPFYLFINNIHSVIIGVQIMAFNGYPMTIHKMSQMCNFFKSFLEIFLFNPLQKNKIQ